MAADQLTTTFAALADPASRAYYDRERAEGKRHNADRIPYQPRPLPALASAAWT